MSENALESILSGTLSGVASGLVLAILLGLFSWLRRWRRRREQIGHLRECLHLYRAAVLGPLPPPPGVGPIDKKNLQLMYWSAMLQEVGAILNARVDQLAFDEVQAIRQATLIFHGRVGEAVAGLSSESAEQCYRNQFSVLTELKWLKLPPYKKEKE